MRYKHIEIENGWIDYYVEMKKRIKQFFCRHEYGEYIKNNKFHSISGERVYIVCNKCGKIKGSYYKEYEGNGYK